MFTEEELKRLLVPRAALPGFDHDCVRLCRPSGEFAGIGVWGSARPAAVLCVDLADDATADRMTRWFAGLWRAKFPRLHVPCTSPDWHWRQGRTWELRLPRLNVRYGEPHWDVHTFRLIPSDAELPYREGITVVRHDPLIDFEDTRCLPGGARFVDRLAMALSAPVLGSQT